MSRNLPALYATLKESWLRSIRARNSSPKTVTLYDRAGREFMTYLAEAYPTVGPEALRREHIEGFLEHYSPGHAPATVSLTYRAIQQWLGWLVDEDELATDPTARMEAPFVPEKPVPVLSDDQLKALLATASGRTFTDRRDTALLRLFIDTGCRLAEITGLAVVDLDLSEQTARVMGKGRRERTVPFGLRSADALDRYLRARTGQRCAAESALWIGERGKGAMTPSGVYQVLRRRGVQAGEWGHATRVLRRVRCHKSPV